MFKVLSIQLFIAVIALNLLSYRAQAEADDNKGCEARLSSNRSVEALREAIVEVAGRDRQQEAVTALHNQWRNTIYQNYPEPMVRVVHMILKSLMNDNPIAFYEYVKLCRDENHVMFGSTGEWLLKNTSNLVSFDGTRYRAMRQLREMTLALVNDQNYNMALLPPPPLDSKPEAKDSSKD